MASAEKKQTQSELKRRPAYVQADFYANASLLRRELEEKLSLSAEANAGMSPLMYVFSRQRYQFLTASGEHIFTRAILDDLIEKLSVWAISALGTFHVSTPQVRTYVQGSGRELVRDKIGGQWHYVLSLTSERVRDGWLKILSADNQTGRRMALDQITRTRLTFNQLIVHDISEAYGIDFSGRSMDPLEGVVFLDGYLW